MKVRNAILNSNRLLAELARDPALLVLTILTPVFFFFLTVVGYSREPSPKTWLVEADAAAFEGRPGLAKALREARHADGRPSFSLRMTGALATGNATPVTRPTIALRAGESGSLGLEGDALSRDYVAAANRVEELLDGLAPGRVGAIRLVGAAPAFHAAASEFEAYVPGMMVFAILLLIPQTALIIGRERRRGTMTRIAGTEMGAASYLGGVALSQSICALAQGFILVALAAAFAYPFGPAPLAASLETLAILVLLGFGSVAQGLVVGAFAKSDSSAINAASVLAMMEVFLSGSFFAMPSPVIASMGQPGMASFATIGAYDFLPAVHAIQALRRAMLDSGRGISAPLIMMAALTFVYFSASVLFFRRRFSRAG
jgi:ABC-type multidrug transport system permease subunit